MGFPATFHCNTAPPLFFAAAQPAVLEGAQAGADLREQRAKARDVAGSPAEAGVGVQGSEFADSGREMQIAGSELVVLPGNSYHVAATHADVSAEATLDFLARRGGA